VTPVVGPSQPPMEEVQQPLADDSTYAGSTMPGTPVVSMKLYVRVFMPTQRSCFWVKIVYAHLKYLGPD
jgi:hypothetical protein